MKILIVVGVDLNFVCYKIYGRGKEEYVILMIVVCINGYIDIVKLLIKECVDVNVNK